MIDWLRSLPITIAYRVIQIPYSPFSVFAFPDYSFQLHLILLKEYIKDKTPSNFFSELTDSHPHVQNIYLWEDQWCNANSIIKNRLMSKFGMGKRIHGRKTEVRRIDKSIAQSFLETQHLQGYASAYYKYGLYEKDILFAVALFSKTRQMRQKNYRSAELIRYANLEGYYVSGGLGKLVNHYMNEHDADDVMTYVDRDWGNGNGYIKIGFEIKEYTAPQSFWLDTTTFERHSPLRFCKEIGMDSSTQKATILQQFGLIEIYNSGNIKMVKYC